MLEIAWQAYLWTWRKYSSFKPYDHLSETNLEILPQSGGVIAAKGLSMEELLILKLYDPP